MRVFAAMPAYLPRLIPPAMQHGKQPFWAQLELLVRLTLNTRNYADCALCPSRPKLKFSTNDSPTAFTHPQVQ
jgi:hypothetical protein